MPTVETVSKAGITTSSSGERHIPASTRADGSVRKEIRVRPGYRPPEDVEVYKNRTSEAWRTRGSGGVPGAEPVLSEDAASKSHAAAKNARRREAKKKAAVATAEDKEEEPTTKSPSKLETQEPVTEPPVDPEVEKEKDAKKLLKKLRQARDLKDKKEKGDQLLPEQFEKVIKINELIRQLDSLGFDTNGEKKAET
jgi:partner of Y14 and mago protein